MVGWHHRLNGHGFGWTPGIGDGQGGLACCGSWGRKESDTTERLSWTDLLRTPKCKQNLRRQEQSGPRKARGHTVQEPWQALCFMLRANEKLLTHFVSYQFFIGV